MEKHFELTDETIEVAGNTMHRIRCTRDCKWAKTGDLGGFIEKEDNLSGDARVYDNAQVSGDARLAGKARVAGNDDHCGFDVFGSIGRHTHAYRTSDGGVEITCGCFHGDIEAFEAKVRHTHGDSQYAREYLAIAHVIRVKFGLA